MRSIIYSERNVTSIVIIFFTWCALYLSAINVKEINRSEGRRLIPAAKMVETGDYVSPSYGGTAYFTKPPMIYWIIGGAYKLFGVKSIVTGRFAVAFIVLISVICVWLLNKGIVDESLRNLAPLMLLTSVGLLDHGRVATIAATYESFTLLAIFSWLYFYHKGNEKNIALWFVPALFLGGALLTKGPLVLLAFYIFVGAYLYYNNDMKKLVSWQHLVSIVIMVSIFCLWYLQIPSTTNTGVSNTFKQEMLMRFDFSQISFSKWLSRVFESFLQFMPWIIPILFLFKRSMRESVIVELTQRQINLLKASIIGFAILFFLINLIPLTKARYSFILLPLVVIASSLVISALLKNKGTHNLTDKIVTNGLGLIVIGGCIGLLIYSQLPHEYKYKTIAKKIRSVVPENSTIIVSEQLREPFMFYLDDKVKYVDYSYSFKSNDRLLTRDVFKKNVLKQFSKNGYSFVELASIAAKRNNFYILKRSEVK